MGSELTTFWLVVQCHVPVPHINVREIFNGYCLEAIRKNIYQVRASTCNGFPGDLYQLKHADIQGYSK